MNSYRLATKATWLRGGGGAKSCQVPWTGLHFPKGGHSLSMDQLCRKPCSASAPGCLKVWPLDQ